jgi:hypothetical protein
VCGVCVCVRILLRFTPGLGLGSRAELNIV